MRDDTVITISRQYCSGGRRVGQKLAETLGIPFYDNEIITLAARESGLDEVDFERAESKATNSLIYSLYTMGKYSYADGMPFNDKVFRYQSNVIQHFADKGACVIVGRCADFVLAGRDDTVHVFLYANIAERARRAVEDENIPEDRALEYVEKADRARATYYSYHSGHKWGKAENYDLCMDITKLAPDDVTELIIDYVNKLQG